MKLESLTEMVQRKYPGSTLWVEQENEEVYLKRQGETEPLASFKGSDEWSFEDLLRAAENYLRGVPDGITFERSER